MNKHTGELLEKHFDTAFAAPDGIKKLRELILTLGMQGTHQLHQVRDNIPLQFSFQVIHRLRPSSLHRFRTQRHPLR